MAKDSNMQQAIDAVRRQQFDEAIDLLSRHLNRQPNDVRARWLLVQTLEAQQKPDRALAELRTILHHVEKDLPAIDQIAQHMRQRRYPLAQLLDAYQKYLAHRPNSANAAFNYAYNLSKDGQFEAAIKSYERSLELGISAPEEVHLNIANIYLDHLHEQDKAKAHLQAALACNPAYASAFYNLGNLSERQGNRDDARNYFERCLQADPANETALARLAETQNFAQQDDPLLTRLVAKARNSNNPDVHFALGKACEQIGNFEMAWTHFARGNALDRQLNPAYVAEGAEAFFKAIASQPYQQWLQQSAGLPDEPVFICGMFRSGSTLLEQMLASHPAFVAGGESEFFPRLVAKELPEYPQGLESLTDKKLRTWQQQHNELSRKLFGDASRPTDKRPDNFLYTGLIKAVLPSAKFIVTERDWKDVAASIFSVRLGPNQPYATSLDDIRHYIGLQEKLVDHWAALLGSDLKRVNYEDLVQQPKRTMSDLLDWLGETWDERCLSFHELRNTVSTASVWQVREPLHSKSIGRWKNFKQQFVAAFGAEFND